MRVLAFVAGVQVLLLSPLSVLGEDPLCPHHHPVGAGAAQVEADVAGVAHEGRGHHGHHHHGHKPVEQPGDADAHEDGCECLLLCTDLVGRASPDVSASPTTFLPRAIPFAEVAPGTTHLPGIIPYTLPLSRPPPVSFPAS